MALKEFKEILKKIIPLREREKEKIHVSHESRWTKLIKMLVKINYRI